MMPQRFKENGVVTFDWGKEIDRCRWNVEDILARCNPNHPATLRQIMDEVICLANAIEEAWSKELSDDLFAVAEQGTKNMLTGMLAIANMEKEDHE